MWRRYSKDISNSRFVCAKLIERFIGKVKVSVWRKTGFGETINSSWSCKRCYFLKILLTKSHFFNKATEGEGHISKIYAKEDSHIVACFLDKFGVSSSYKLGMIIPLQTELMSIYYCYPIFIWCIVGTKTFLSLLMELLSLVFSSICLKIVHDCHLTPS